MIVLGMLGAMSADPTQVGRPSVLPPLDQLSGGPGAGCALDGVEPGKPIPKKLLRKRSNPTRLRILRPGDQATMDFLPNRINIHIDDHGNVTHVTCG